MTRYIPVPILHSCRKPRLSSFDGHMQHVGLHYDAQTVYTCPECGKHWAVVTATLQRSGFSSTYRHWEPVRWWMRRAKRQIKDGISVPPEAPPLTHKQAREMMPDLFNDNDF